MTTDSPVTVSREGDLAWVTIDNPPVNATSAAVRAGLAEAVKEVQGARVAILTGAGRTFVAGGDMSEFDAPPVEPHLPDVVQMIEDSETPFVAVLHGTVLGGGFEIAMACAWRIAQAGTRFGLPEVNVGLIPGAGGTQRAPRLIGMEAAIDMAASGQMLDAQALKALGGLDLVFEGDLQAAARTFVTDLPERPEKVSERVVEPLAEKITAAVSVPTIGIGASAECDGQILVVDDVIGLFAAFKPKFVKRYASILGDVEGAISDFAEEVRTRKFPSEEFLFGAGK